MATQVDICNMALKHIGANGVIANLNTDNSVEAKTCKIFYDEALKFVLSDVNWSFARKRDNLSLLSETWNNGEEAPDDWGFAYVYPNDCLKALEIFDSTRRTINTEMPFEISLSPAGVRVILTDQEDAQLLYTKNIDNTKLFSPSFVVAMSYYLAYLIAYAITKKRDLRDDMKNQYMIEKTNAEVNNANEESIDELPLGEFLSGR